MFILYNASCKQLLTCLSATLYERSSPLGLIHLGNFLRLPLIEFAEETFSIRQSRLSS